MTKNVSNMLASAEHIKEICHPDVKPNVVSLYNARKLLLKHLSLYEILFATSRLSVHPFFVLVSVRRLAPIPAGDSQDVTNKSYSICLRDDKNALTVTP